MLRLPADRPPRVHFSGIGGMGMVAGARLALDAGWEVRGSDNPLYPPSSEMVERLGVPVATEYGAKNLDWDPDLVVIGNALSRGNPEVEAVLERRLHHVSLAEWIKDVVLRDRRPVVVSGTHGKTTTTALLAHILLESGADAGYFVGGQPRGFEHSARLGALGQPFAIEGDEYDTAFFDKRAKFLHYLPQIAVVTSIDFDHGDIYRDIDAIELAFRRMLRQVPFSGWLVACADHDRARRLREGAPCRTIGYGFAADAEFRIAERVQADGVQRLRFEFRGKPFLETETTLPGRYNALNCAAAGLAAHLVDVEPEAIAAAIRTFAGVKRRMEVFHEAGGIAFVEDFAHHPRAIREAIAAAREHWPGRRLVVAFEPRTNTTTTRQFQEELEASLAEADATLIGPIHRIERIPEDERLNTAALAERLTRDGKSARAFADVDALSAQLASVAGDGDLVLVLSNGAFGNLYAKIREGFPA